MRVGEILLDRGWVDPHGLHRAIAEQRHTGKRLCSLLISRGLLDPDHASRALAEQHDVSAILQRHLENRERAVVPLVPAAFARARFVLPIGRNRNGDLVVCVRDPSPQLGVELARATGEDVVITVCPATLLERLIDLAYDAYEPSATEEYDVDLSTDPGSRESLPAMPRVRSRDSIPDLSAFTLVELDDVGVAKDHTQSAPILVGSRTATSSLPPLDRPIESPRSSSTLPPLARPVEVPLLEQTLAALGAATTRDAATELAMRFAHGRWGAALLLAINEECALGHRGHGPQLSADVVQAVAIPLASPSIIKVAHDRRRLALEPPPDAGVVQERLDRMLGRAAMAASVAIGASIGCVIAVGDPVGHDRGVDDLERLAAALGVAYTRIARDLQR